MFFHNLTPQSYQGDDTVCSFLIPLNELFEYYLFKLFDNFGNGTTVAFQEKHAFACGINNDYKLGIRPDIVLRRDGYPLLIVDAKYKNPGYLNGIYTKINQADIYQVFAYAKIYAVDKVALIYPQFENYDTQSMVMEIGDYDKKVYLTVGCIDIRNTDTFKSISLLQNFLYLPGGIVRN
jgi:5-methylcytosine-specific restriction enzyme subunit McrC